MREHRISVLLGWIWVSATFATTTLVLLGSWYPFEWMPGRLDAAWQQWLASTSGRLSKSDFAINLMLGVPLGFFGVLALARLDCTAMSGAKHNGWRLAISAFLVLVWVIACGLIAELGQHWCSQRVPSAYDTLAQGVGGCVGVVCACLGGVWFSRRVSRIIGGYGDTPLVALLDLYVAGYAAWMLMPFIPSVSPSELKQKWKSGMIQLSFVAEWRTDVWQALYTAGITSVSAIPIGFAFARFLRKGWVWTCICAVAFVVGLEVLQIGIETRYAQASDALWAAVGAVLGVCFNSCFPQTQIAREAVGGKVRYAGLGGLAAFIVVVAYLCIALAPFEWIETKAELVERVHQLRSEMGKGMLAGNDMTNASNLLRTLFMSMVLGATFGCTSPFRRTRSDWFGVIAMAVLLTSVCAATELLQTFSVRHNPSLLAAVVRIAGGWVGLAMSVSIITRSTQIDTVSP